MWRRWKAGQSWHQMGRAFGKDHVSIQFRWLQHGGIAPTARRRLRLTRTRAEREDIPRGIASGSSLRDLAKSAAGGVHGEPGGGASRWRPLYRASEADHQAWESALRPKVGLLAMHVKLQKTERK